MKRTWTGDGLDQWPVPVSLSDNVLNASKHDLIQITTRNKSRLQLLSDLIAAFHTSADALSGRRLSYAVHFNEDKSPIQCDRFPPVKPLSWYLCRILDKIRGRLMFVKPVNTDVGIREFSSRVHMLIRSQRRSHTHLFSDLTAAWGDGGDGRPAQSNLRSDQHGGVAGSVLFSDWLKATSFRKPARERRVASVKRRQHTMKRWF